MGDVQTALDRFKLTCDGYVEAKGYYEGTNPEVFASLKLKRALLRSNTTFRVNFAGVAVDVLLNRLEIKSVQVVGDEAGTALVEQVWTGNQLDLEATDFHRWGLTFGECYGMAWPSEDSTDEAPSIDIHYNSPLTGQLVYDVENPRKKRYYAKRWTDGNDTRLNLYYPDRIEKYIAQGSRNASKDTEFQPFIEEVDEDGDAVWPQANPFGKIPAFHFRTERPNGRPVHAKAFGPQDLLNKLIINQMSTSDFSAFPQRYALSDNGSNDLSDFEDIDGFGDADALPENATEAEVANFTAGPGELWDMKGVKSVGQFAASDVDQFLKPFGDYIKAMAAVTDIPVFYFQGMGDPPSGAALRVAVGPLDKHAVTIQNSFGATWSEMLEFGLEILGLPGSKVQINWQNPSNYDDIDWWKVAAAKVSLGVPLNQVLIEAGYDPDDATDWAEKAVAVQEAAAALLAQNATDNPPADSSATGAAA